MRKNQVMLNSMRKHRFLVAKGKGHTQEAYALQSKIGDCGENQKVESLGGQILGHHRGRRLQVD
eukprot:1049449-Heterocapsa_arctica.AAC.1